MSEDDRAYETTANSQKYLCPFCGAETQTFKLGGGLTCSGCQRHLSKRGWPGKDKMVALRAKFQPPTSG